MAKHRLETPPAGTEEELVEWFDKMDDEGWRFAGMFTWQWRGPKHHLQQFAVFRRKGEE